MNGSTQWTADEVAVWRVDLQAGPERLAACAGVLSEAERARAAAFLREEDRRRYMAAHGALRDVLGRLLSRDPAAVAFADGPRGKPALTGATDGLEFNLSHSHECALIACARGRRVGVDLEWMRADVDIAGVVASTFSAAERREWEALPAARQRAGFFHAWVRKEAYVKALGQGLAHPTEAYTVRVAPDGPAELLADALHPQAAAEWRLAIVPVPEGYAAALAVAGGGKPRLQVRDYDPAEFRPGGRGV